MTASFFLLILLSGMGALSAPENGRPDTLGSAEQALLSGHADVAAASLRQVLSAEPGNGRAHLLLCRVWLSENLLSEAVAECRAALDNGLEHDSAAQDWTGRVLGHQAEHAGIVSGLKLALAVRDAFETAVNLDPRSADACLDLGEYYAQAPAIVGGGRSKALALADRVQGASPELGHRIRAMVAEKEKDDETAEREFHAAAANGDPGALVDLAEFYGRHHEHSKAVETAEKAIRADRRTDKHVMEAAVVLADQKETEEAAIQMRRYLGGANQSEIFPAFRVHTMLGKLLLASGNKIAARVEFEAALALASQYEPAKKALGEL